MAKTNIKTKLLSATILTALLIISITTITCITGCSPKDNENKQIDSGTTPNIPNEDTGTDTGDYIDCPPELKGQEYCTMEYDPVCGDDGITYSNVCVACSSAVDKYKEGEC